MHEPPRTMKTIIIAEMLLWYCLRACETQWKRWLRAVRGYQFCYPDIISKHVEQDRGVGWGHSQAINFMTLTSSESLWNTIEALNADMHRQYTLLPSYLSLRSVTKYKRSDLCKTQTKRWVRAFPGYQHCHSDIVSKRVNHNGSVECRQSYPHIVAQHVKHNRSVERGHSQAINFIIRWVIMEAYFSQWAWCNVPLMLV